MASKPETRIVESIRRQFEIDGWIVIKIHGGPFQVAGLPDLLLLRNGVACFVEVKTPTGKVTKLQQHWIERIRAAGFRAGVATNAAEARSICES